MFLLPKNCFIGLALTTLAAPTSASEMFASDSPWMLGDWAGPEINLNILYPGNRFIPLKVRAFVKALTSTVNVIALGDRHLEFASH